MDDIEDVKDWLENLLDKSNVGSNNHLNTRIARNNLKAADSDKIREAIDTLEEECDQDKQFRYYQNSVSRGKSKGNYYPRLVFQNKILKRIGFNYKTPLKVRVDLDDEEVTFSKA